MKREREISFDDMLEVMSHIQRRKLLLALTEHNPQDDAPFDPVNSKDEASIEQIVQMKHVHLPKLVDHGFIEWDRDTHEVSKGRNFEEIRPLLELLDEHADELPEGWL
ncbi:ArsR family transcriptional regulator [Halovenus amylolytica]|uniref:ArsR family transcriptional regulator n=1 Tax=Halovenus amylolytica TaxID=2500550 RepID=UPI00361DA94C